jgi:hypothetical protein
MSAGATTAPTLWTEVHPADKCGLRQVTKFCAERVADLPGNAKGAPDGAEDRSHDRMRNVVWRESGRHGVLIARVQQAADDRHPEGAARLEEGADAVDTCQRPQPMTSSPIAIVTVVPAVRTKTVDKGAMTATAPAAGSTRRPDCSAE